MLDCIDSLKFVDAFDKPDAYVIQVKRNHGLLPRVNYQLKRRNNPNVSRNKSHVINRYWKDLDDRKE